MTDAQKAALAAAARDWSGANVPYVYGGTSRQGADCSGSVSAIFAAAGMPIGHMSSSGFAASGLFARSVGAPQIGDVGWYPGHVVIFGGNTAPGMDVWSASHTGGPVFGPAKSSWYGTPICIIMWGLEDVRIGLAGALIGTAILVAGSAMGAPCDGIDRTLSTADRAELAAPIAAQLHVPSVDVLQSFRDGAWRIVYVDSHVADEAFLFFSADPARQHYLTLWGGAATPAEAPGIETWAAAHAPGVPKALAACFAWRATGGE